MRRRLPRHRQASNESIADPQKKVAKRMHWPKLSLLHQSHGLLRAGASLLLSSSNVMCRETTFATFLFCATMATDSWEINETSIK
jgi:hypothetical protein